MTYELQFSEVWPHLDSLFWGGWLTLRLSALSMLLGLLVGMTCAFLRTVLFSEKPNGVTFTLFQYLNADDSYLANIL